MTNHEQGPARPNPQLWAHIPTTTAPTVLPGVVDDIPAAAALLGALASQRWITACWQDDAPPGLPRQRLYQLTPAAQQQLPAIRARWQAFREHRIRSLLHRPVIAAAQTSAD